MAQQIINNTVLSATTPNNPSTPTPSTGSGVSGNLVKVIGYAQRQFYSNGIEYRNFTDDLVGNQQTSSSDGYGDSVLTIQNFITNTSVDGRLSRIYDTRKFSDFYNLESLNLDSTRLSKLLKNNIEITLNNDKTKLSNFAYFGSATEFIRVSLENIITNWPASLFLRETRSDGITTVEGNTAIGYNYNGLTNRAVFTVDTNFIINNFELNYQENGTIVDTYNEDNDLRNLTVNYSDYVIYINDTEYAITNYTGSTNQFNDYIHFEVVGDPFSSSTNVTVQYHIKPKSELVEEFFNSLNGFENTLLNRLTSPKYTAEFSYKVEDEFGNVINATKKLTWPTSDGYNIDFNTPRYLNYATELVNITNTKDILESDLMTRFLTSGSISDFDTLPRCNGDIEETSGQKMNRTLKIYGREFDEIKQYMDGISFANVVTYDKKDNIPDQLVKYLARTLGWELVSSIMDEDLISSFLVPKTNYYPGHNRGLTAQEADVELWRRLILNSPWIWKSKGTRKAIEFFFKFVGAPDGLINLNEYVYLIQKPIDMDVFYAVLERNGLSDDLSLYNIDEDGYPVFPRNNSNMYFQKGGQWYRETTGERTTQHISTGNNPHVGPYDNGREYLNQLNNIIPNFRPFTITTTTTSRDVETLFDNYNDGVFNNYNGLYWFDLVDLNGVPLMDSEMGLFPEQITDPCPISELTDCGCDVEQDDEAIKLYFERYNTNRCLDAFLSVTYDDDANLWLFEYELFRLDALSAQTSNTTIFASRQCCSEVPGNSFYYEEYELLNPYVSTGITKTTLDDVSLTDIPVPTGVAIFGEEPLNQGYICCKSQGIEKDWGLQGCGCVISCQWQMVSPNNVDMYVTRTASYLKFIDPAGNFRVVNEADSCFCIPGLTNPEIIQDPYTGTVGYACRYDSTQVLQLAYNTYQDRARQKIGCDEYNPIIV